MLMNIRLAFSCQKDLVTIIKKPHIYNYRLNDGCITKSFNSTPEYENIFQKCLIDSIPIYEKDKYFKYTIKNRLANFHRFLRYKYCVKGMKDSMFYKELKNDIEEYEYRLPVLDRILLYNDNAFVRYIANKAKYFQRKFLKKQ